jgi:hypothetical protein
MLVSFNFAAGGDVRESGPSGAASNPSPEVTALFKLLDELEK